MIELSQMRNPLTRGLVAFIVFSAMIGSSQRAWAHAILVDSNPRDGATIAGPNFEAVLSFNSRIDQSRSKVTLDGPELSDVFVPVAPTDQQPAILKAKLTGLKHGLYMLHWQVLAVDGHITRGVISFQVR